MLFSGIGGDIYITPGMSADTGVGSRFSDSGRSVRHGFFVMRGIFQ